MQLKGIAADWAFAGTPPGGGCKMRRSELVVVLAALTLSHTCSAAVYRVSPDGPISSLASIVNTLQPGDVVEVESGTYNEAMRIWASGTAEAPITIRGVGPDRPLFDAIGLNLTGAGSVPRAIFQLEGENIVLENIEMINATETLTHNAGGVRILLSANNPTIRNCKISNSNKGIGGGCETGRVLIENCDVGFNGSVEMNGYRHNFYMGGTAPVILRGNYIHDAIYGQNFKSRAHYVELWYNWIADSNEGEVGAVEYNDWTGLPNSNVLMVGNVIISKENRTGNLHKYVHFGTDSGGLHNGTLYMFNNTVVANHDDINFIEIDSPETKAVARNNIFVGTGANDIVSYQSAEQPSTGSLRAAITGSKPTARCPRVGPIACSARRQASSTATISTFACRRAPTTSMRAPRPVTSTATAYGMTWSSTGPALRAAGLFRAASWEPST
ncbi:MAG: right-handed parallel beta-helix repeat-containing protein [Planctomycetes bacterium]|nr:right-handed parallel beta-helix repeat-containing protein [Planctomycetota bacterium]